jgi:hypothetical protein
MSKDILTAAKSDGVTNQIAVGDRDQRSGPDLIKNPDLRPLRDPCAQGTHAMRKVVRFEASRFRLTD